MSNRHERQCKLCQVGVGMVEGKTHVDVAEEYGISEGSVRRHRKYLRAVDEIESTPVPDGAVPGADHVLAPYGLTHTDMRVRGATVRDEVSGSWVRLVRDDGPEMVDDALLDELFREPISVPDWEVSPHGSVLAMSDLQIGKAMERGGGTAETLACVRQAVGKFVAKLQRERPAVAALPDGGDIIENIFNTHRQASTNDLDVPRQIREARRILAWAIRQVAPLVPSLLVPVVPSNHSEARSGIGIASGTSDADYGLDINYALEEIFEGREGFEHVQFIRPEPLDDTVVFEMAGTKIALNHGYHSKGVHKHPEWWAKMDHGRRTGWDADILLMNHYHTFDVQQSGDGRWIISASSPDPGSEWFSKMTGKASKRGLTTFSVRDGEWFDVGIL